MRIIPLRTGIYIQAVCAAVVITICGVASSSAQAPLHRQPNKSEKAKLVEQIAADGLNCPVVGTVDNAGEDTRGKMIRVHCSSLSGAANWDVRGIAVPNAAALHFESW